MIRTYAIRAELPDGTCQDFPVHAPNFYLASRLAERTLTREHALSQFARFDWRGQVVFVRTPEAP